MAATSPYDGPPSDRPDKNELACVHSPSRPPPDAEAHQRMRKKIDTAVFVLSGGLLGLAIYGTLAPWAGRTFNITMPWSIQGPLLIVIFLGSSLVFALLRRWV